ncbi:MAG: DUF418 domain-containing protein [Flavisolibacter sp.]
MRSAPVNNNDRAPVLDMLRGFAILGIFLNNIYYFSGYGFLSEEAKKNFSTYPADKWLDWLQITFIEGKFYTLFSLLFGIGFSIILIRNEQRGTNGIRVFYRRLLFLMLIGAIHLYFFWEGDILFLYALVGLLLPLFRRWSDRALLTAAAVLILSPIIIDLVKVWTQWSPGQLLRPLGVAIDQNSGITEQNWRGYLFTKENGLQHWHNWQRSAFVFRYMYILDSNRIVKVLGIFLIGYYVGRKMMYARLPEHKALLKKVLVWGAVIGLPFCIAMTWFEKDEKFVPLDAWGMADTISYALGVVPLGLALVAGLSLWWLRAQQSFLRFFIPVGKMALTNYLSQTAVAIFFFYGVGLGWGQRAGLIWMFAFVVCYYMCQILFSRLWLAYFNYGPFEWIWRQLTYGKTLPLRKRKPVVPEVITT